MFDDFDKAMQPYLAAKEPDIPENKDYNRKLETSNDIFKEKAFPLYKRYSELQRVINQIEELLKKPGLENIVGEDKINVSDEISGLMSEVGDCYNEIYKLYQRPKKQKVTFEVALASAKMVKFLKDMDDEEKLLLERLGKVSKKVDGLREKGWDVKDYSNFFMRANPEYEKKVGKVIEILN